MFNEESKKSKGSHRHKNRILAVQFFYMWSLRKREDRVDIDRLLDLFFDSFVSEDRRGYIFTEELIYGVLENIKKVDAVIEEHTQNWSFNRISLTELAILRMAIYELLFRNDIPPVVSINEAIDLSKEFSGPSAKRFINGILDKVKGQLDRPLRKSQDSEVE